MTKKEIIWREILHQAASNRGAVFTQKNLAQQFDVSLSTVFNALRLPRQAGAIEVSGRSFRVLDFEKFLYLWATQRNLDRETIYTTHADLPTREIEGAMPPPAIFGGYSAYRLQYGDAPADYDKVYAYFASDDVAEVEQRFPSRPGYPNLIVLRSDPYLHTFGHVTPDIQTFVDLWNAKEWYAREFLAALREQLRL